MKGNVTWTVSALSWLMEPSMMWGEDLELLLPTPSNLDAPSQLPKPRSADRERGIHYQEQLSPFLNDKMLSNMGEDLGVHEGLGAPHTIPQNPEAPSQHPNPGIWVEIEGYVTGYSSAPFWAMKCSVTWGKIWGYSSRSPNPKDPSQNPKIGVGTGGYLTRNDSALPG